MQPPRFWELDALRGLAILLMIIFHLVFDLVYIFHYPLLNSLNSQLFWFVIGRTSAILFLILVGISLKLKYYRIYHSHKPIIHNSVFIIRFLPFLTRGLFILIWALLITILTSFLSAGTIYFGILHLIGTVTLLVYPLLRFKKLHLLLALVIFALPTIFAHLPTTHNPPLTNAPWFLPLGIFPPQLFMLDYYPLVPWSGFIFLGIWLAGRLYSPSGRLFPLPEFSPNFSQALPALQPFRAWQRPREKSPFVTNRISSLLIKNLTWLGRHSLAVYLLHQPVILGLLWSILT